MPAALNTPREPPPAAQPVIRSERLVLRPLRRSDIGLIALYTSDKRVAEGTRSIPHPLPPGTSEAYVSRAMAEQGTGESMIWAIDGTEAHLSELLGVISLSRVAPGQCELEFWIGAGFWNTGFATEAVEALIRSNPRHCQSFVAEVFQDNPGSARVLSNCGFDYLGDAESWSVSRGAHVATWTYARPMTD